MAKRKTIGDNPLDAVVPNPQAAVTASQRGLATAGTYPKPDKPEKPPKVAKERLTVHVTLEIIDRVKNAVYWTPGLTLSDLAEQAFAEAVGKLEEKRGEPFPPRKEELKGGRPLK